MITNPPEQLRRAALLRRLQQHSGKRRKETKLLPILPADRREPLPLSWAQQRLWFLDRLEHAAGAAYHIPAALRLSGKLNQGALQSALDRIVARHESLRTTFVSVEGTPTQVIAPAEIGFALRQRDLSSLEGSMREAAMAELAVTERSQSFDLATGPLIRGQLLRLAEDEHVLLVTQHHIISDGWSIGVLVRELSALYSAFSQGEPDPLPELKVHYADYAVWQREWLADEVLQKQIDFWREHLTGAPALLELPTDRPRPAEQSYQGSSIPITLSGELTAGLRALSQRHGTTLFMTLLGGWSVLLSRLSGQTDVVLGTPVANRQRSEIESLIGLFVNTLALRVRLEEDPSVAQLLEQIKATTLGAYAHQDLPFEQVVEALQPERSLSHSALFQATLVLNNLPSEGELTLPGLRLAPVAIPQTTTQFDLILSLSVAGESIVGNLGYAIDLFDASTVERMTGYFITLLSAMVEQPTQRISQLELLSPVQRRQLLVEFNATQTDYPSDRLIHELFEAQAARTPKATALVLGEEHLNYGELNRRANQIAHYLIGLGVRPNDRVAICVERSLEMVVGLLGILKAGGAYVPLDPSYPNERLAYMLKDSAPMALLTQSKLQDKLETLATSIRKIPVMVFDRKADRATLVRQADHNPDPLEIGLTVRHLAYVIYTSGSTGRPKGVMISTGSFANHIRGSILRYQINSNDRVLQFASMSFDPSLEQILSSLAVGATLILRGQHLWSPKQLAAELVGHAVTVANVPPSYSSSLIGNESVALPSLRLLIIGGDALLTETVKDGKPTFRLMNAYGPTETTITAATFGVSSQEQLASIQTQYLPIGRPVTNMQMYILDAHMQPVPLGVSGEIYIGGLGVAEGYLNRPELTEERFVPDPFDNQPDRRLYKTGDLGRWLPDGNVEYLGRNDLQVKIRGLRIELGEIEARLVEHPGVREAVVIAREDRPAEKRLVAYVVPKPIRQLELWPSVGEHLIYDDLLYYAMTNDDRRNDSYKVAINRAVRDKIVVEIGTGKDAILSRFCVEAGARKVYAIELLEETYHKARALIEELGLQDRIILIHGDAMRIELPEKADVCVSEIVGPIGGCEGAGELINNAWRFMKKGGVMIPERATTRIAAVSLPSAFLEDPAFTEVSARYVDKVFERRGYRFDLRLCLRGARTEDVISTVGIFEDLDHTNRIKTEYQRKEQIVITRESRIDGFLVWLNLYTVADEVIDILEHEHCWLPVYCPVFYPGIDVTEGDMIELTITSTLSDDRINPNYNLNGWLKRQDGKIVPFDYNSDYSSKAFKQTPFYEVLFREDTIRSKSNEQPKLSSTDLRGHLDLRLPDYMVPTAFVHLDSLPLTPNGKINRRALPAPAQSARVTRGYEAPTGEIEVAVARVWEELLGLDQVGRHDHFFELGGHSMLVISLAERLRGLGISADERMVFVSPILAGLAAAIADRKGLASTFAVPPNRIAFDCTAITPELLPLVNLAQGEIDQIVTDVPGGAPNIQDIYPLAPLQEGILFHHLLDNQGDDYLLRTILAFDSRSRLDAFLSAMQVVIERHDILRSAVYWQGLSQPVQVVYRRAPLPVEELALTSQDDALAQLRVTSDPRHLRLDLQRAPLMKAYVAADKSAGEWLLSLLVHHMMSDHVTLELMISEIQLLLLGRREQLPAPLPYRNFIAQANRVTPEEHESYFRQRLWDVDGSTAPFEVVNVRGNGIRIDEARLSLSNDLAQRIRAAGREQGVTPAMLFHVAWAQVVARCSGRDDVVFGTVLSGRLQGSEGADRALGMFINTLPLRIPLGTVSVREAVRDAYRRLNELLEHEQASLALAQRCSGVTPPLPLFTSLLNYRHSHARNTDEKGNAAAMVAWEGVRLLDGEERTNYPLAVSVDDLGEGFALTAQCAGGIDATRIVNYLERAIAELVETLGTAPEQPAYRLNILPESERRQLLVEFNDTKADYATDGLIHQLFEEQTARASEATALVFEEERLSYGELNRRANQVAHYLIGLGIRPDDRVAICMERSLEMAVGLLGILKAGGAYVPLDPSYPEERLAYMLEDSAPVALLTQSPLRGRFSKFTSQLLVVDEADDLSLLARQPQDNPDPTVLGLGDSHLVYVIYTSGSTGLPKGVMNEHGGLCNLALAQIELFGVGPESRVLQFASLSFDASISEIMMALCSGATLHLGSREELRPGKPLLSTLQGHQITHVTLPASVLQSWTEEELPNGLLTVVAAGEALPNTVARRWASGHRLFNAYGPTEATVCATTYRCEAERDGTVPIGRPLANTQIYILDQHLEPVPMGVSGEIYIGGVGVARGYLNRPELTAERFIANPFSTDPAARLYKSGDLGRWLPDGNIEYLGRNDFQVKIRGFRIELGEIEARLLESEGVREAVVIAREDKPGEKRLVAYVVMQGGVELSAAELREELSKVLADYMLPSAFVSLEALPLTPSGKLDRRALPAPDQSAVITRGYEAPVGELEVTLAEIWQELLGLERVGRHDHFFELGGHSLLAVQVVSRLRQRLKVEVAVSEIFTQSTLAGFARIVAQAGHGAQPPLLPADRTEPLPLSWAQQRLWFLDQLDHAAGGAYHIPAALRLSGKLNQSALQRALDRIVGRHESLRTTFVRVEGTATQVIASAEIGFALHHHDLISLEGSAQESAVAELAVTEGSRSFDFAIGPLIRGQLLRLAEDEHVLLVTQHHIISDGWSIGVLVRELSALYSAFSQGEPDPLPELTIQYADYAVWQREWLKEEVLQKQIEFWREHLSGAPALLELPTDRPRPAEQSYKGSSIPVTLSVELTAGLRALSQRHGTTLFMTLLGGWSVLLSRLSGQTDVVIGTPVANRQRSEIEPLIGFFVNTLALRVRLEEDPSVTQLLEQIKGTTLGAYAHQDLPFEQVVEALQPKRSLSHSALFQAMLVLNNLPNAGALTLPGLRLAAVETPRATTQFDLTLSLNEAGESIVGGVEYSTDLFDASTVERMMGYFVTLLSAMVKDEAQRISQLPLLSAAQRQQLLVEFNAAEAEYQSDRLIHELFEEQAARSPEATALVFEQERLSYRELNRRANQVAHRLIKLGVRPDDRVAICVEPSLEMVIGLLGILKAGGGYVPLDPGYPTERLDYMLEDSKPSVLLTQTGLLGSLANVALEVLLLDEVDDRVPAGDQSDENPDASVLGLTSNQLAYVIYTSGSTGMPKGVMVEHRNISRLFQATEEWFHFGASDVWTLFHSFAFDFSVWEIWGALLYGGRLVVVPSVTRRTPEEFYRMICREGVTILNQTPTAFRQLITAQSQSEAIHRLRHVIFGGEALELHMLAPWIERNDPERTRLINMYGITEITVHGTYREISRGDVVTRRGSLVGKALPDLRIYLLDGQLEPVPLGVSGELYVGGAGVARGYLNRPELTAERFIVDPFSSDPAARLYKTGDLGRWLPDGNIEYLGRNDFQVKIRGFRIELGEIEARLAACEGVREAVVIARGDSPGEKRLIAYVVPQERMELSAATLRDELSKVLADYMVPSAFVSLNALPLTANGKLDRHALPAPNQSAVITRVYEAPMGEIEEAIADVWRELLGLEQVGRHDHFFELGGHSLLVVNLIERLRERGVNAEVRMLFVAPTLAGLAAAIVDRQGLATAFVVPPNRITPDCPAITPEMLPLVNLTQGEIDRIVANVPGGVANIQDIYPLAPLQDGILFHHLLENEGDAYLLRTILAFESRSRLDAFLSAMQVVIDRHDILRSAVYWQGLTQPVQVVHRQALMPVEELTLALDEEALAKLRAATDPRHLRLDLQRAPLMKAYVVADKPAGEWLLAFLDHHIVSDNQSLQLFIKEIQLLLAGRSERLPIPLPYRNFIAHTHGISPESHEKYFRQELGSVTEPTAPYGVLNVRGDGTEVEEASITLNNGLAQRIREAARREGVPPAVLFHVAWAQVLGQCSGRNDVVFGTVLSGRLQGSAGADRVLGMFINTLPLRIRLGQIGVRQVVHDTYVRLGELLEHEQASLVLAQRCSGVTPPMPLFTALLNYRHSNAVAIAEDDAAAVATSFEGTRLLGGEERTNYPLAASVDDLGQQFILGVQSISGIDPARIASYLETAIEALAQALSKAPEQPAHRLNILPEDERRELLIEFNDTEAEYPGDRLIHALFEEQASRAPEAIALIFGEERLSYGDLNRRANQVAHHLIEHGIHPNDHVAICVERGLEMVVGLLGILKAGGAYVPLDPSYPKERLAYMLEDCEPKALLTQADLRQGLPKVRSHVVYLDQEPTASELTHQHDHNPDPVVLGLSSIDLAYVIYTSGSTGLPKGAMNIHRGIVNRLCWMQREYALGSSERVLHKTPLSFDVSVWEIFWALSAGATLVIAAPGGHRDPAYLAGLLNREKVNVAAFVPSVLNTLLNDGALSAVPHLRLLFSGGEALPVSLAADFARRFPGTALVNLYGPTEASIGVSYWPFDPRTTSRISPIGRPISNVQLYILGAEQQLVPVGVSGELHIGGVAVGRGYYGRPKLTEERFISNPFSTDPPARLYKTGDLARWLPDGNIEYLGRNDFQVKIRGFRIELGEIEARLLECKGVREAVVIAREDNPGEKFLVAYVVSHDGVEFSAPALREELSKVLADYMVPSAFVSLGALPLTPSGKLDRRALPAPDQSAVITRGYEAPVGEIEVALAEIWQDLLGLERVGRHDHFFELGGHSLLAVQVVSRLRQRLKVEVALREIFTQPTLAEFARIVAQAGHGAQPALLPTDRTDPLPLSWAQQRLWFLDQLDHAAGAAYHISAALRLSGKLNDGALQAALDRIVARHESLRTTFVRVEGTATQVIASAEIGFALIKHDLSSLGGSAQEITVGELAVAEGIQSFDLGVGPLIRGQLLHLGEDEQVLLVTQHHIISDGWSIGVLVRELSALYSAFSQGEPDPLPELTIQYADYAVWQREWLKEEVLQKQIDFWREHLSGAPALLELPTDRSRPAEQSYKGSSIPVTLSAELTAGLRALSQRHGTTLFMTLLGGWSVLLSRLSGQTDVVIGTPVANRQRSEIEPLIGFFVNTLALRVRLEEDPSVAQLLEQIKSTTLGAYAHQDLPFEQVVEALQPERSLSHSALFQAMLVLNNLPNAGELTLPGLRLAAVETPRATTQFDLTLSLNEAGESIVGGVEYSTDLFDASTVERMLGYFVTLLGAMVKDEAQRISQLPLLSAAQRQQLLVEFNAAEADYQSDRLIHELFEEQAARLGEATALVYDNDLLSYGDLNRRANQIAHYLITLGIRPDDRVAICVERSFDMVVGLLGVLKAGGAYVPIDPGYPSKRISFMLSDSKPIALLTQAALVKHLAGADTLPPGIPVMTFDRQSDAATLASHPEHNPDPRERRVNGQHLAYVIYTSGSTGHPKGVMISTGSLADHICGSVLRYQIGSRDRVLQFTSTNFDPSLEQIFSSLAAGATLVLRGKELWSPQRLSSEIRRQGITVADIPPSYATALIGPESGTFPSLRLVIIGGEALLAETVKAVSPKFLLMNAYGPTETTITATTFAISSHEQLTKIQTHYLPIGRPVAHAQVYILDSHLRPVAIGVSGEIYIGGRGIALGYLNQPQLTADRFIADPFNTDPAARLYRTGDLGRWLPDGNVYFLGRNDFQVKIRGLRIELGEIEARLVEHPGVREAAVLAREDTPGDKRLVAYVVPKPTRQLELWPSVGEHLIYDDLLYYAMTNDERRNNSYKVAINRAVKGKTVVEIGTGKDAILSRICVEAGASKVYAIELLEEHYHKAKALIKELGLQDRIILIHGDAMQIELPEKVDVCVSETLGAIGGCEGARALINNAWRFMKKGGVMIPERATTRIAAVCLPNTFLEDPAFTEVSARYVDKIFERRGHKFDFRLCLRGLSTDDLVSTVGIFEDLDYTTLSDVEYRREEQVVITRESRIDGLVMWLNLYTGPGEVIDILEHEYNWLPVYCPIFYPGIDVAEGDAIQLTITSTLSDDRINPNYNIKGWLKRQDGQSLTFDYSSDYSTNAFKQTPFYEALFVGDTPKIKSSAPVKVSTSALHGYLAQHLPDYMLPTAYVRLDSLPLTPNGKLDRQALPAPDQSTVATQTYEAPAGGLEITIAQIWQELLGLDRVGRQDHFFELGGHSLMVISLIERLRQKGFTLDVRTVFLTPTLAALAAALAEKGSLSAALAVPPNRITPECTEITPGLLPLVDLSQQEINEIVATVPGGVRNVQDMYPLAPLQEGILFHHLLQKEGDDYLLRMILAFDRRDRLDAFLSAMQEVIDRHDILRSAVHWQGLTHPVQVVYRKARLQVEERNPTPNGDALSELRAWTDRGRCRLNLRHAPLMSTHVIMDHISGRWLLSLLMHHLMSDHVTLELMLKEIELLLLGQREQLAAPLPLRNFIATTHAVAPEVHEGYFRQQLADVREPTAPFGVLDVQGDGTQVEEMRHSLSEDMARRIRDCARRKSVTPAVLFHIAWAHVLARCSGREDVVFGTVLSGRLQGSEGADRVLGMFINTLPIRIPLDTHSITELVQHTYRCLSELLEHEHASLALAQRCSGVAYPLPLFTAILNYRHSGEGRTAEDDHAAAVAWEGIRILGAEEHSNYPLALSVTDLPDGFALTAHCRSGINAMRIVSYLEKAIEGLVEALGTAPEQPAYRLNILPESERRQLLVEFNATEADYPSGGLIHQLFEEQTARASEATALVFEEERLSYAELNRRANQVAHCLIGLGIRPDDRVAICMERSLEMVVGMLGILKAGGAYVPLDRGYPEERLAYMIEDSAPVALLTQSPLRGRFSKFTSQLLVVDETDGLSLLAGQPQDNPDPMVLGLGGNHLAYVIYTSGSTGLPKGVMNEHGGLCNLALAQIELFEVGPESRVLQFASLSFDASISEIMMALCSGATLHLGSREELRPGKPLLSTLQGHQITHVTLPASVLQAWTEEELPNGLLTVVAAGEALPRAVAGRWASGHRLFNAYGPTEATVCATTYRCEAERDGAIPIGRPLANTQIYILDQHLEPVPMGVSGEIYIGGVGVARGYLNRPELTTERFIANPFSTDPAERLYKSGDLGRWLPDGNIEYLGRNDFQVKIRGFRIELGEIEARLLESEGVREAVVIAREDKPGEKRLVAYVVMQGGVELSAAALREELSKVLAEHMVPSAFVSLEALPLTPNGKVDRAALSVSDLVRGDAGYVAPRTPTETLLSVIWSQVLSLDKVGVHDSFCALGGHSLLAVRLFYEIKKQWHITIPLETILATPTVAMQAIIVELQRQGQNHDDGA